MINQAPDRNTETIAQHHSAGENAEHVIWEEEQ